MNFQDFFAIDLKDEKKTKGSVIFAQLDINKKWPRVPSLELAPAPGRRARLALMFYRRDSFNSRSLFLLFYFLCFFLFFVFVSLPSSPFFYKYISCFLLFYLLPFLCLSFIIFLFLTNIHLQRLTH